MVSSFNTNIGRIVINGQNVSSLSGHQKMNTLDLVALQGYILILLKIVGLQERADPGQQTRLLNLGEISHFLESFLVDVHRRLHFQLVW